MVAIPQRGDPTLEAADKALEDAEQAKQGRDYLGMSGIGHACERKLWYDFRDVQRVRFDAATLKRFADGHASEDVMAARLRLAPGVTLITLDPETGRQIGHQDHSGHFRGHQDGEIVGLLQAPKTWHVWEAKAIGDKNMSKLKGIIAKVGEKDALREWNMVYYVQACLYMHYTGLTRHYMTVSTPGAREWISVRTDADAVTAQRAIAKAERIIFAAEPPPKIDAAGSLLECRWCDHRNICHDGVWPDRNCRTCLHSTPERTGGWSCARWNNALDRDTQRAGCPTHKYVPGLVPGAVEGADETGVTYRLSDGSQWKDGE